MKTLNIEIVINDYTLFKFVKIGNISCLYMFNYAIFERVGDITKFFKGKCYRWE